MSQETGTTETFNRRINIIIAVIVAIIAVLGSLITKLESEASTASNKATVAEQQYYYKAIGVQIRGKADVTHAFGTVYQLWYQYNVKMLSSKKRGEDDAVRTYTELKDAVAQTSTLFDPKYFNNETGKVNLVLYEADEYRKTLYELEEKQLAASETASAWDDKSSIYILQLTLLAVAGFLLGLALMTKARVPTLVFAVSGILLVVTISAWAYRVSQIPVIERPTEAITAYAEGASLIDQKLWEEALVKLNEAIEKGTTSTSYGRAYLLRAQVHSKMENFQEAIADYKMARESGFADDPTVDASLVQAFFNIGDFSSAIETGIKALDHSPDNLTLRQQVIMAMVANGDIQNASEQTSILLEKATEKVKRERELGDNNAAAETWWLLNEAAHQYDQLVELLKNNDAKSPVKESILDPLKVREQAGQLASQLRSTAIALKFDITEADSSISTAQIDIKANSPSRTPDEKHVYKVDLELQYSGIQPGQLLSIVTYRNGIEEPSWGFSEKWTPQQVDGTVNITISPSYSSLYIVPPGFYTFYIYLNELLLAQGDFMIEDPNDQSVALFDASFTFDSMLDQFEFYTSDFIYGDYEDYDWYYDDWYYDNWYYYFYDSYFFFGDDEDYIYFLEGAYDPYSSYCTDPNDLDCYTSSDYDGDGVPDDYDYCVYEPGSWDFDGCPYSEDDADGDGINDIDDPCPYDFYDDCLSSDEDSDGDGINDIDDPCPYDFYDDCLSSDEDSDGDGVNDFDDPCPYDFYDDCLSSDEDSDGDGVNDFDDPCPYDFYDDCLSSDEDSDGDGVPDWDDPCPYDYYDDCLAEEDSDGDGVPDWDDPCPYDYYDECVDSDGDGTPDVYDPCPDDPYDGCGNGFDFKDKRQKQYLFFFERKPHSDNLIARASVLFHRNI